MPAFQLSPHAEAAHASSVLAVLEARKHFLRLHALGTLLLQLLGELFDLRGQGECSSG